MQQLKNRYVSLALDGEGLLKRVLNTSSCRDIIGASIDYERKFVKAVRRALQRYNVDLWLDSGHLRGVIPDDVPKCYLEETLRLEMEEVRESKCFSSLVWYLSRAETTLQQ